jgi:hypothetical protein
VNTISHYYEVALCDPDAYRAATIRDEHVRNVSLCTVCASARALGDPLLRGRVMGKSLQYVHDARLRADRTGVECRCALCRTLIARPTRLDDERECPTCGPDCGCDPDYRPERMAGGGWLQ